MGKFLQHGDENAERALGEVLAAKEPGKAADELLSFVKDEPQAVEGAKAAFWKVLRSNAQSVESAQRSFSGRSMWQGDKLKRWLENPSTAAVASRLYRDNPEHLTQLHAYADVLDSVDLRTRAKGTASSGTAPGTSNILTPETLQSRALAYKRGQIGGMFLLTSIVSVVARRAVRSARSDAIERLTDKVFAKS